MQVNIIYCIILDQLLKGNHDFLLEKGSELEVIELLLKNGANVHARTDWGDTICHYAALTGSIRSGGNFTKHSSDSDCKVLGLK